MAVDLSTSLGQLKLSAPMLTASGCAAAGKELSRFFDLREIGAVVTKSIMQEPRSGRAVPRTVETPSGMLNSIGLQGPGLDRFIEHDLAWLKVNDVNTVVSIAGNDVSEFGQVAARLVVEGGIAGIEINISCPNVANRGLVFACQPASASEVVTAVRRAVGPRIPLIAKLTPDVTDIVEVAASVQEAGADAVAVINTVLGMVIDRKTLKPYLGGRTGGLSGPAIRPIAVRAVYQIHAAIPQLPILGMGGIRSGMDALEFVAAGASAVSVGTAIFSDPTAPIRIQNELADELSNRGFESLSSAVGVAHER